MAIDIKSKNQEEIKLTHEKILNDLKTNKIPYNTYLIPQINEELKSILKELTSEEYNIALSLPPSHILGDLSFPVFELAKILKANPNEIAINIAKSINQKKLTLISKAENLGPYVNIFLNTEVYSKINDIILRLEGKFGFNDLNKNKIAIIDYSSVNIAKPFNVGHLRSTVIGQALSNIYEATGFITVKDNHLGDWGTQFGALIYAYKKWGDVEKIKINPIRELRDLYVRFHEVEENEPEIRIEARKIFNELEMGSAEYQKLWREFYELSMIQFAKIYNELNIEFDLNLGESFYNDFIKSAEDFCLEKSVCQKEENGAISVKELNKLPSFLLKKEDGSSLYMTRDLAGVKFRIDEFKPQSILYVVGSEQELHFRQLFALCNVLGLTKNIDIKYIPFGLVLSNGKKMSTRKGKLVELEELISETKNKAKEILKQKKSELLETDINKISEIIGIGAMIFNDLSQNRVKDISFDWEKMLDFEGGSAAYLQYTSVRISSLVKKVGEIEMPKHIEYSEKSEWDIAKKLMFYPEIIISAQRENLPNLIANYLEELASLFNTFYNDVSILKTGDVNLKQSRIALIKNVNQVLKNGLRLLNIQVPERM